MPGMVWIPEGTFLMGTNDKESFPNERPAHLVDIRGFWMDDSGAAIGAGAMPTLRPQAKTYVATLLDRLRIMIQAIRPHRSAWSKAVPSFATRPTARVIGPARAGERRPIRARLIRDSGARSLERMSKLPVRLEANLLSPNKQS
jgi:Sulfatase-modifying factor enzyme 1